MAGWVAQGDDNVNWPSVIAHFDGTSWTPMFQTSNELYSLSIADPDNIWISGSSSFLYHSADAGMTWDSIVPGFPYNNMKVQFTDSMHGWIFWHGMMQTVDGGNSWTSLFQDSYLQNAFFFNDSQGWYSANGRIFASSDGGINWMEQSRGTFLPYYSVLFNDEDHGWATGFHHILYTDNGGDDWQILMTDTSFVGFTSISFLDPGTGYISGSQGLILKSIDSGMTWSPVNSGTQKILYWITCPDPFNCWACGEQGTLLHSQDQGPWHSHTYNTDASLSKICFSDPNTGWAVGLNGTILQTPDGGENWALTYSGTEEALYGLFFSDHDHGWICGEDGLIMRTINAGYTWEQQYIGDFRDLISIFFLDNDRGYTTGAGGYIWYTENGGVSWTQQDRVPSYANSIFFINDNEGWISNDWGIIHTDNGGFVGIQDKNDRPLQTEVSIFPNPATDKIQISFNMEEEGLFRIELLDLLGRSVYSKDNVTIPSEGKTIELNTLELKQGLYLIRLSSSDTQNTKKIMILND